MMYSVKEACAQSPSLNFFEHVHVLHLCGHRDRVMSINVKDSGKKNSIVIDCVSHIIIFRYPATSIARYINNGY